MAAGRIFQSRLALINQATLVRMLIDGTLEQDAAKQFALFGSFSTPKKPKPLQNALVERIITDIYENKGKLIVDEKKFKRWADEIRMTSAVQEVRKPT